MSVQRDDPRLAGLEVYRVGGAVRDKLLGWPVYDNDWVVVGATPDAMLKRGFKPVGRDFPVFLHPDSAEEYALARTERKAGHGYAGFQVIASPDVTLEDDLLRRDLTINAIAEAPDGMLIDPFNGQQDIEARRLRHVSPAFSEDPLRVLRTARFLARYQPLGFAIASETLALMNDVSRSGELAYLAAERVWLETQKALGEAAPASYFTTLEQCEALSTWWPELAGDALKQALVDMALGMDSASLASADWRYALLVSRLTETEREALAQRLRLPNAVAQLARHVALTRELLADALNPSAVARWLERLDAWRKPAQVDAQLTLVAVLAPEQVAALKGAWQATQQVSPQTLMAEGYQGAALGAALKERRQQAIVEALA
ncbi:polynucleotide adenylyltransferase [Vreelandella arcis]|uniref:tRNA nucleotidyltransferase (CCA-adding enzyme) n=1 Tax=Vreelandella arcis TaxID=416873 RepID=A0A1H0HPN0_9GAMM|nr:polynucleotide adenylyltransferase [Halomonas arcis]SDO21053.1 tRNA nucleotidyltransferase (CCA-adding enzyme) [Halomonas arcis]